MSANDIKKTGRTWLTELDLGHFWKSVFWQSIHGLIGAILYGVLSWAINAFPMPSMDNIIFRPAVVVLIFFGVAYGPWVGFFVGLVGGAIGGDLAGWDFYWNWILGAGFIGFVAGMAWSARANFRSRRSVMRAVCWGVTGTLLGTLFSSLTEIFVKGIHVYTALTGYFVPVVIADTMMIVVLLPILMLLFADIVSRRG
jgi:energy-coupling factor transport system substrate-specific component